MEIGLILIWLEKIYWYLGKLLKIIKDAIDKSKPVEPPVDPPVEPPVGMTEDEARILAGNYLAALDLGSTPEGNPIEAMVGDLLSETDEQFTFRINFNNGGSRNGGVYVMKIDGSVSSKIANSW